MKNIKWLVQAVASHSQLLVINERLAMREEEVACPSLLQKAEVTCQAFLTTRIGDPISLEAMFSHVRTC